MKSSAAIVVLVVGFLTSACAPMLAPPSQRTAFGPMRESPVGRWDLVMGLEPAVLIGVTTADGVAHTGRFVRAGMYWLRLFENGAELEIDRNDVARVDYLGGAPSGATQRVAGGAASGAVVAGATEMLFALAFGGKLVFPGRSMALGAAGGAVAGAMDTATRREQRAIYVAPQLVGR